MSNLELFVRPYQTRDISPPSRVFKPESEVAEDLVIVCGVGGAPKLFNGSFQETLTRYMDNKIKEHSGNDRKTTTKTITNPDDPSQKLDIEMIDNLTTKTGRGQQYQKTKYIYDNTSK
jgi:hypothetical protein